jgi:hypothetical protein
MNTHADKTHENKSHSVANSVSQKQSNGKYTSQFEDNRPETVTQRKLQEIAVNSPRSNKNTKLNIAVNPLPVKSIIQKMKYGDKEIKSLIELNQTCDEQKLELKLSAEDFPTYTTAEIDAAIANTPINLKYNPEKEMLKSSLLFHLKKLEKQRPKIIGETSQIIQSGFQKAIAGIEDGIKTIMGATSEQIIESGLRQATKHLLQFYDETSLSKFKFPSPEELNTLEDVGHFESILLKTETDFQNDDYMHYWTLKKMTMEVENGDYKAAIAKELGEDKLPEVEQSDIMRDRRQRANKTTVGRWAEVASHYIKLKRAFLHSWQENEHGELKNRAFYYLLKRMPEDAHNEMAGNSDIQAAIGSPKSGHVALGIGLEEVFDTAACHEDALQLVKMLGAQVTAKGEAKGPQTENLHGEAPKISAAIEQSKTSVTGVRLKDASNHSVVLLFEKTLDGWQGNTYETIAGQNTESIMTFMEGLNPRPLKDAKSLLQTGLTKAVQISNDKWKLEWEVFEVADPTQFGPNLLHHVNETLKGVATGLNEKKKASALMDAAIDYDAEEEKRDPKEWMGKETDEHMDVLRALKKD